jgi:hypothetical protein
MPDDEMVTMAVSTTSVPSGWVIVLTEAINELGFIQHAFDAYPWCLKRHVGSDIMSVRCNPAHCTREPPP